MVVFSSILLLFSASVYLSIVSFSHQRFYELLKIRTETIIHLRSQEYSAEDKAVYEIKGKVELPSEKDYIIKVTNDNGFDEILKTIPLPQTFFSEAIEKGEATYNDTKFAYAGKAFVYNGHSYIAVAGAENLYVTYYLSYLKRTLITCIILSLFFSAVFSFYVSKTLYKPILKITSKVKHISSENLHLRLESSRDNKELNELIDTFNDMLNRIETSFETQNHLIGNVSHELRTPLTSIMGEADVALSMNRSVEDYKATLGIILDEAEKLDKKIKALLMIAQTGFDGKIQKIDIIRADELLWDVIATAKRLNAKNNIFVDLSMLPENPKKLKIKGNEQLLHLAISNIINNGCKYSNFERVKVSLGATDSHVYIIVKDQGIGIPENEMDKIYDPFFRASNTRNYEGYGIGLPLARNIIIMHQGELIVSSNINEGTTVQIRIPTIKTV